MELLLIALFFSAVKMIQDVQNGKTDRAYADKGMSSPRAAAKYERQKRLADAGRPASAGRGPLRNYLSEVYADAVDTLGERHRAKRAARPAYVYDPAAPKLRQKVGGWLSRRAAAFDNRVIESANKWRSGHGWDMVKSAARATGRAVWEPVGGSRPGGEQGRCFKCGDPLANGMHPDGTAVCPADAAYANVHRDIADPDNAPEIGTRDYDGATLIEWDGEVWAPVCPTCDTPMDGAAGTDDDGQPICASWFCIAAALSRPATAAWPMSGGTYTPKIGHRVGGNYVDGRTLEWTGEVYAPVCSTCNTPMGGHDDAGWLICESCGVRAADDTGNTDGQVDITLDAGPTVGDRDYGGPIPIEWDGEVWAPVCPACDTPMGGRGSTRGPGWLICETCGVRSDMADGRNDIPDADPVCARSGKPMDGHDGKGTLTCTSCHFRKTDTDGVDEPGGCPTPTPTPTTTGGRAMTEAMTYETAVVALGELEDNVRQFADHIAGADQAGIEFEDHVLDAAVARNAVLDAVTSVVEQFSAVGLSGEAMAKVTAAMELISVGDLMAAIEYVGTARGELVEATVSAQEAAGAVAGAQDDMIAQFGDAHAQVAADLGGDASFLDSGGGGTYSGGHSGAGVFVGPADLDEPAGRHRTAEVDTPAPAEHAEVTAA